MSLSKKKIDIPTRLFAPIDVNTLTDTSPVVVAARNWSRIASMISQNHPYLSGVVSNRKVTIDAEGLILLFKHNEAGTRKIASSYVNELQDAFTKYSKTDFAIKAVFEEDIEDLIIDIWKIKSDNSENEISESDDPLDKIGAKFSGIVEYKDDDKGDIDPKPDLAEQQEIDESEEFLTDEEQNIYEED